jgi:hypothetical protein
VYAPNGKKPYRKLMSCQAPNQQDTCRAGRICLATPIAGSARNYCADAPLLTNLPSDPGGAGYGDLETCFAQLATYKVSAGGSFVVAGSVSGAATNRRNPNGAKMEQGCQDDAERASVAPHAVSRIWLGGAREVTCQQAPAYPTPATGEICIQGLDHLCPLEEFTLGKLVGNPPVCTYLSAVEGTAAPAVSALFENEQLRFIVTDLDKSVDDSAVFNFQVQGGFSPQLIAPLALDAEVDSPSRILTSPISSVGHQPDEILIDESDRPMLFVVDQRRTSRSTLGAVRGQVVRIRPDYGDTLTPVYEGFSLSGSYYPLQ